MSNNYKTNTHPGQALEEKRITLGLTQEEVAKQLHLKPEIIKAIESWELSGIPGIVFIKGYVRAYAKILSLDAQLLLQNFDSYEINIEPNNNVSKISFKNNKRNVSVTRASLPNKNNKALGSISLLIILSLVVFLFFAPSRNKNITKSNESKATQISLTDISKMHPVSTKKANTGIIDG